MYLPSHKQYVHNHSDLNVTLRSFASYLNCFQISRVELRLNLHWLWRITLAHFKVALGLFWRYSGSPTCICKGKDFGELSEQFCLNYIDITCLKYKRIKMTNRFAPNFSGSNSFIYFITSINLSLHCTMILQFDTRISSIVFIFLLGKASSFQKKNYLLLSQVG